MLNYLQAVYDSLLELSPDEIIGSLFIGLALAMACSGLCILGHKRTTNPFPLLCGLILAFCAVSMAVGVGYSRHKMTARVNPNGPPTNPNFGPGRSRGRGDHPMPRPFSRQLLLEADLDRNGHLTPEEAAEFVRSIDAEGKGWANIADLERVTSQHPATARVSDNRPESSPQWQDRGSF